MFKVASRLAFAVGIASGVPQSAYGQANYPNRIVQVVNPTLAGSTTDILARALSAGLSSRLGQQFVVVNKAGAGGAIGTAAVARAEPDGYTLLFGAVYVLSVLPALRSAEAGYESDALVPVCQTVSNAMVLAVAPDSLFKSLGDLIAAARAQPGSLNYGHQGVGSIPNLAMEELMEAAGAKINAVPYRGDPAVVADLLGKTIDVGALVQGSVAGQNLRILGIFSEERHSGFPGTPTVREQGYEVAPISFGGLLAPAATPRDVVTKLAAACENAARDEGYAAVAKSGGQPDNYYANLATFRHRLQRDIESKRRLLSRMGAAR